MDGWTDLCAPLLDSRLDRVADFAGASEFLFVTGLDGRRVREAPVQARRDARINWATLGAGFIANGDDAGKAFAGVVHIRYGFGLVAGNVYADFLHRFDDNWIELPGFNAGAVRLELFTANMIQKSLGHLASGAVVDANEQDLLFHIVNKS